MSLTLIAHRGYSGSYPENSLLAYKKASKHGARMVEIDLQMTADAVPVLHHDASLLRMAGVDKDVRKISKQQFKKYPAHFAERFGKKFENNKATTFKRFCRWLRKHPEVIAFVEIKQESIDVFGVDAFLNAIIRRIEKKRLHHQIVIISFNDEVIRQAKKNTHIKTGWVLPAWNADCQQIAEELRPEYLFCSGQRFPKDAREWWAGSWKWALYNFDTAEEALAMYQKGITYLETNQIELLMKDKRIRCACLES